MPADLTEAGGYAASRVLLGCHPRPTALIATSERMALGAYRLATEYGLAVGWDVAVISIASDNVLCRYLSPSLSCLDTAPFTLGRRLAELALGQLAAPPAPKTGELWPMRLVERESHFSRSSTERNAFRLGLWRVSFEKKPSKAFSHAIRRRPKAGEPVFRPSDEIVTGTPHPLLTPFRASRFG